MAGNEVIGDGWPSRGDRDNRLKKCDWTQLPDTGLSEEKLNEWKIYRQALRDMPTTYPDPDIEIFWPNIP